MAKTRFPAIQPGTDKANAFVYGCNAGWSDEKLAVEFDFTVLTARKYRALLAPNTKKKGSGLARQTPQTTNAGDDALQATSPIIAEVSPEAEGNRQSLKEAS